MSIPKDGKQKYKEAYSHNLLAKDWDISLAALDSYATEQGWDKEHKLYWQDVALEVLKKGTEEHNLVATKELLRAVGITRPVGRPSKSEVQKHLAIEAHIANEFAEDVARLKAVK
ncbi:hypothetical protein IMW82_16350 [Rhodanobacter sp. B2A1Ga4]|uniref:hypothetical protein n=1 Tax=Rhodanobacter sp. B2A1Ga4 TaxID=2778647 RepID=UPI001B37CFB5|nr:hypothetical protein [Rhodanobacter sp. B2A1Ga4]MBQ4856241.1 hypothetical protein [Rhodanobacter sp. B2A1Ga4]